MDRKMTITMSETRVHVTCGEKAASLVKTGGDHGDWTWVIWKNEGGATLAANSCAEREKGLDEMLYKLYELTK